MIHWFRDWYAPGFAGMMKGRLWARANASTAIGEASVLITLPIDMKKLPGRVSSQDLTTMLVVPRT